jgi:glutamate 5-kinase
MGGAAPAGYSSGGMVTKLVAARIAMGAGCRMVIAKGDRLHPVAAIEEGARCTWFLPAAEPRTARKRWIAGTLNPMGALRVDDGAAAALKRGTSLLPAGIVAVEGEFERGDAVVVRRRDGRELARGISAYSSADARAIAGHKSGEIEAILGYRGRDEMIHRDDLVLIEPRETSA